MFSISGEPWDDEIYYWSLQTEQCQCGRFLSCTSLFLQNYKIVITWRVGNDKARVPWNTWGKRHPAPLLPLVVFVSAMSTRSGWVAWGRTRCASILCIFRRLDFGFLKENSPVNVRLKWVTWRTECGLVFCILANHGLGLEWLITILLSVAIMQTSNSLFRPSTTSSILLRRTAVKLIKSAR